MSAQLFQFPLATVPRRGEASLFLDSVKPAPMADVTDPIERVFRVLGQGREMGLEYDGAMADLMDEIEAREQPPGIVVSFTGEREEPLRTLAAEWWFFTIKAEWYRQGCRRGGDITRQTANEIADSRRKPGPKTSQRYRTEIAAAVAYIATHETPEWKRDVKAILQVVQQHRKEEAAAAGDEFMTNMVRRIEKLRAAERGELEGAQS